MINSDPTPVSSKKQLRIQTMLKFSPVFFPSPNPEEATLEQ